MVVKQTKLVDQTRITDNQNSTKSPTSVKKSQSPPKMVLRTNNVFALKAENDELKQQLKAQFEQMSKINLQLNRYNDYVQKHDTEHKFRMYEGQIKLLEKEKAD